MNEKDIGFLTKRLTDKIKASVDDLLKEQGLTFSQTMVIGFLSEHSGRASQKDIENYLQVSHPTVVGIVSRLEKNGFVECFTDKKDRRNKVVLVTDKALSMADAMAEGKSKMEKRLTKGLSEAELAEFRRMIDILIKNL